MASLHETLDGLLGPEYLDGLESRSLDEIRVMRAECQQAELELSYLRRLAQGRLDIVHAYLDAHRAGGAGDLAQLVDELPTILAGEHSRPTGPGRNPSLLSSDIDWHEVTGELDGVLDADGVGHLGDLDDEALESLAGRLGSIEKRVSRQRRELHERIDSLQLELVSRYKTGKASVEGLLS
jgi:hypothetical protein